ncbi:MAG TPA: BatA and WFA domain-containing protein [Chloroflexia bacterium]|nr:BatA and WFA domain-containing protein [Chloroflexia bacterium]
MLGILSPIALAALPLIAVILALYLLKLRRPTAPVGSLHLWEAMTRDREANSVWQRLRVSLLMILQIAILGALILALARPWVSRAGSIGEHVILLVDVSASMSARENERAPTRLDQAKDEARRIVDALPDGAQGMLIAADDHASVVVPMTGDRTALRAGISGLSVNSADTNLLEGARLASAAASRRPNSSLWIFSDGAFPSLADMDELPAAVNFVSVGAPVGNQGITSMAVRKNEAGLSLHLQVANSEEVPVSRRVDLYVDDAPWSALNVEVPPLAVEEVVVDDMPLAGRVVSAELAGVDELSMDDRAWAVNRASVPAAVLLVTNENKFLETALSLLPTVELWKATPEEYAIDAAADDRPFDLIVFDAGTITADTQELPHTGMLVIKPAAGNPLIGVEGEIVDPAAAGARAADSLGADRDPLLRYVQLSALNVSSAVKLTPPDWGRAVLDSPQGPLLVAGEREGHNVAVLAFDLHDSDLPLQPAFPLLVRNLVTYLLPPAAGGLPESIEPGRTVSIDPVAADVTTIVVEDPLAVEHELSRTPEQTTVAFGDTAEAGVYYVTQYAGEKIAAQEAFTVNLFARDETVTPPNASPGLPPGRAITEEAPATERREIWPWVAALGLLLLMAEWLYSQRIVVRRALIERRARRALQNMENG